MSLQPESPQIAAAEANDPSVVGKWEGPYEWPLLPIHVSVDPNGKVLAWQRPKLAQPGQPNIPQYYDVGHLGKSMHLSAPLPTDLQAVLVPVRCHV